jgi:hypothetical protein
VITRHDRASGCPDVHARPFPALRFIVIAVASAAAIGCGPAPTPAPPEPPASRSPVQAAPNPKLVEFETHLRDATSREGQLIRALSAAATGSNDQLGLAARELADWAAGEQAWLTDHPADACYEDAWQTYASGVDDLTTAAAAFVDLAAAASPPTVAEGQAAAAPLLTAGDSIGAAADLANQARAACR